jgi:hypothetical protein
VAGGSGEWLVDPGSGWWIRGVAGGSDEWLVDPRSD